MLAQSLIKGMILLPTFWKSYKFLLIFSPKSTCSWFNAKEKHCGFVSKKWKTVIKKVFAHPQNS